MRSRPGLALDAAVFLAIGAAAAAACHLRLSATAGGAVGAGVAFGLVGVLGRRVVVLVRAALGERERRVPRMAVMGLLPFSALALVCVGSAVSELVARGNLETVISTAVVGAVFSGMCWLFVLVALK